MTVKTRGSVFQISSMDFCLLKVTGSFMLLLISVALEVPVSAASGDLLRLTTAEHGLYNSGALILSNYETERTDAERRSKWWQKKRGMLGSGILALLTAAAALAVTFLILQCFQKLQQHRDSTRSLRQLAEGNDQCKNDDKTKRQARQRQQRQRQRQQQAGGFGGGFFGKAFLVMATILGILGSGLALAPAAPNALAPNAAPNAILAPNATMITPQPMITPPMITPQPMITTETVKKSERSKRSKRSKRSEKAQQQKRKEEKQTTTASTTTMTIRKTVKMIVEEVFKLRRALLRPGGPRIAELRGKLQTLPKNARAAYAACKDVFSTFNFFTFNAFERNAKPNDEDLLRELERRLRTPHNLERVVDAVENAALLLWHHELELWHHEEEWEEEALEILNNLDTKLESLAQKYHAEEEEKEEEKEEEEE